MSTNIIPAAFAGRRSTYATVTQWDYGQILTFPDLELPAVYQVHFSNAPACGTAVTVLGGPEGVSIPDTLLQQAKPISAYVYLHAGEDDGETVYTVTLFVTPRQQPTEETPTPGQRSALDEAIAALQDGVRRVDDALETVDDAIDAALQEAKDSGDFDGPAGRDGQDGQDGAPGQDGQDGVSPTVTITTIEGGHRVTITDAAHPAGQNFDVMDGQGGGSGELLVVAYDAATPGTVPDVTEIADGFDAGKAVIACASDLDGGGHVLPLTSLARSGGTVMALTFSAGGWTLAANKVFTSWLWSLTEAPAESVVLTFSAAWNASADAYVVTTTATLAEIDAALAAGQRIDARLLIDNTQLLRQGTVYAERSGSQLVSVTIGYFGVGVAWDLDGDSSGWYLGSTPIETVDLDDTLTQYGKAAEAAAVGTALAGKGTYSKPSGGIPKTDLASAVQTSLGKADSAYQKPSGGIPASDLAAGVISDDLKAALLQIAQKVAYIDSQGQTYYQDLYDALYPPATVVSISAVFNQGSAVIYDTDSLDDLRQYLAVTATYDDSTTEVVTTYTLSGTLTAGTSTITAAYSGKTDTFTVNVTAAPTLSSISAVYTQSGIVLDADTLDSLKADLIVTATYSDSSTEVVAPTDYTLSGTLSTGTSTITVSYASKTTTFTVTVSGYVTDGLIMWLDGERNGVDGAHTPTMSTWVDQSGNGWDWDNMGATVGAQAISFSGNNQYLKRAYNDLPTNVAMMEVVFSSPHTGSGIIMSGFGDAKPGTILMGAGNGVLFHTGTDKDTWTKLYENNWDGGVHSYSSGGYRDGVYDVAAESFSSSWQYLYPAIGCYLGSGGNNPQYQFKGSIYCIRMYSRVLTQQEILSNYAVDAARFGIGG